MTPDGKNGWGNEERQYYTDDPANAATDGDGNLVITLREADGSLECYYGTCEYTSARLLTQDRQEFAYGRIESRLLVPDGGDGLWPAFWSLGTDITRNPWPGCRRDRLHGVREPAARRDLRDHPRSRLRGWRQLRRHLRLRRAGV